MGNASRSCKEGAHYRRRKALQDPGVLILPALLCSSRRGHLKMYYPFNKQNGSRRACN